MFIAWTTLPSRDTAQRLAAEAVARGLAVCVQVDGPIASHYIWEGKPEHAEEFRLTFKCLPDRLEALEAFVHAQHPYAVPEWLAVSADRVAEKYLSWARSAGTNPPL
jgi:periplasmic divalent cation tolerance protein